MHKRVLFITKKGLSCSGSYSYNSSGLFNSAEAVVRMLIDHGVEAKVAIVRDNNDIDREVSRYKPEVVVVEALWVVPEKFEILSRLHPEVQWVVRIHSDIPFLAQEGIAVRWIREYVKNHNVYVGFNKHSTLKAFAHIVLRKKLVYLPNYFPAVERGRKSVKKHPLNIGSFGAIRPLKNQLIQAMAAIQYANESDQILHFHINARIEGGSEILKNLQSLFRHSKHKLIEHVWHGHRAFQHVLERMDISMCVSLSETFCMVAADSVSLGVPLVCSSEIPWASSGSVVQSTDTADIVKGMHRVTSLRAWYIMLNRKGLEMYDRKSTKTWLCFLGV